LESAAFVYQQNKDFSEAERLFLLAIKQDLGLTTAWVGLSEALLAQKKYEDVLLVLQRLCKDQPSNVIHRVNLATAASQVGDLTLAENTLREVIEADRESDLARVALAKLMLSVGKSQQAVQAMEGVAQRNPKPAVYQLLAVALEASGDMQAAKAASDQAKILLENPQGPSTIEP
jgi:predicted Zn-dependent protease